MTEFGPNPDEGPDPKGESVEVTVARLQERAKTFATREWVQDYLSKRWQTWLPIAISIVAILLLFWRMLTDSDVSS